MNEDDAADAAVLGPEIQKALADGNETSSAEEEHSWIDDLDPADYADLTGAGYSIDQIHDVVVMHQGLHPDGGTVLLPGACKTYEHGWSYMIDRYLKLDGTPKLDPSEPMRATSKPSHQPYMLPLGLRVNPDGTIPVDGRCPVCTQGTLVIGATVAQTDRSLPVGVSNALMCINSSCINPGAANKLLTANWAGNRNQRMRRVNTLPGLPDTPIEAGQQELLQQYEPTAEEVAARNDALANGGRNTITGVCSECEAPPTADHADWCSWAPKPIYGDDDDDYPGGADDYDASIYSDGYVLPGEDVAVSIELHDDTSMMSASPARSFTPAAHPVGPDPADRPLYTCHVDRCGHTPADPCKAAKETLDEQHTLLVSYEVPD